MGLAAIFIALSTPIVSLIYGRGLFDNNAISFVSGLLIAYGLGMPAYLSRDLLVRVFYSLEDAEIPFKISLIGIFLNFVFDWLLLGGMSPWGQLLPFNLGAFGLVIATMIVNIITCLILLCYLKMKLLNLNIKEILKKNIKILFSSVISCLVAYSSSCLINWPNNSIGLIINIMICSVICIVVFSLVGSKLNIHEINDLFNILRKKKEIIHL